jgi:Fe-S-cluster containining protein
VPDQLDELERQMERASLFTHTALTDQATRANESDALLNGLVDVLIKGGVVNAEQLRSAVEAVRHEAAATGQAANAGVTIRVDGESRPGVPVDCEARLPICHAACCRLRFALSAEEIEAGVMRWDLGRPYINRQSADGYCAHCDGTTHACHIYDDRPTVCRHYSCADDPRIWTDFAAMELNSDWIEANLGSDRPSPVEIYMHAHRAS